MILHIIAPDGPNVWVDCDVPREGETVVIGVDIYMCARVSYHFEKGVEPYALVKLEPADLERVEP